MSVYNIVLGCYCWHVDGRNRAFTCDIGILSCLRKSFYLIVCDLRDCAITDERSRISVQRRACISISESMCGLSFIVCQRSGSTIDTGVEIIEATIHCTLSLSGKLVTCNILIASDHTAKDEPLILLQHRNTIHFNSICLVDIDGET